MSPFEITLIMFISMLCLMALGLPITFCLGSVGILSSFFLWGSFSLDVIYFAMIDVATNIVLTAIPMFMFMGFILHYSGIASDMFDTIYQWAGGVRGALGIGTVVICASMAAMIGISGATVLSLGSVVVPVLIARGYNKRMSMGIVMSGGALGFLIPPSMVMIMYGFLGEVSVGRLFAAGVVPGIILSLLYMGYVGIRCYLKPEDGPALPLDKRATWKQKFISLKNLILPLCLAIGILGSIFSGIASPTEAAAAGAGFSLIFAAISKKLSKKILLESMQKTIEISGFAGMIIVGALIFSKTYTGLGATSMIKDFVIGMDVSPWLVLILIQISFFILGMFLDDIAILFMCMPIYLPVIRSLGYDPVWFGVLYVLNMQMAYLTPPYGLNLFYMKSVAPKNIFIKDIYLAIVPFLFLQLAVLILVIFYPELALYLPNLLFNK